MMSKFNLKNKSKDEVKFSAQYMMDDLEPLTDALMEELSMVIHRKELLFIKKKGGMYSRSRKSFQFPIEVF